MFEQSQGVGTQRTIIRHERYSSDIWRCLLSGSVTHPRQAQTVVHLHAGSSTKPQIPSDPNVHAVFESQDLVILHTCFMCPSRALNDFPRQTFGLLTFWGYLCLKEHHIFGEKQNKTKQISGSAGAH